MKIFCNVTDWTERVGEKGRGKGNTITSRISIGRDKYNWIVGVENKGKDVLLETKYHNTFEQLLVVALTYPGVEVVTLVKNVLQTFKEKTGKMLDITGEDTLPGIGKKIDDFYKVNRFHEVDVQNIKKMFGKEEDDEE
jgi:hypothetical protein